MTVTKNQINAWKKEHGRVHCIECENAEGKSVESYFSHPTLDHILAAQEFEDQPTKPGKILYENCKLSIDPSVENDDEAKIGMYKVLVTLFRPRVAKIKEV